MKLLPVNTDLKFPFTDLSPQADLRNRLLKTRAERERIEKLKVDLTAERTRLLGTGEFESPEVINDLSAVQSKLDLIPAKLRQLEALEAELEAAIKSESAARFNEVFREGAKVMDQHKVEVEDLLSTLMPRAVDYRDGLSGKITGRDSSAFDRAVQAVLSQSEISRLVAHARSPISYTTDPLQQVDMVVRGARMLVSARKLLGSKAELKEQLEIA